MITPRSPPVILHCLQMIRVLLLAALACLVLANARPAQRDANSHRGAQAAQPASTPIPSRYRPYADRYSERCYAAQDHDSADLCAQWRSAISSEKSAHEARRATNWAIVATFLSLIGVAGLIYTLWQTQGALKEARRGNILSMRENARATRRAIASAEDTAAALAIATLNADAASAQVKVSKQAIEAQMRAWVVLDSVTATEVAEGGLQFFDVAVVWKNVGKTPARDLQIGVSWKTFLSGTPIGKQAKPTPSSSIAGVLGSGLTAWTPVFKLTPAQFLHQKWSIISRVTYHDVFSRRQRVSEIHLEAVVIHAPNNQYAIRWTVIGSTTAT